MKIETERKLQSFIDTINKGMDQVARIVQNHEHRIDALEGEARH